MSQTGRDRRQGAVKQITSHSNPVVKEIKGLVAQRKHRNQSGLFVAEGLKLATDALEAGWDVRYLALGPEARENPVAQKAAATAKARGALILEVSTAVMSAMTRKDNPQMVVGVYEQKTLAAKDIDAATNTIWVALDRVRDPGNLVAHHFNDGFQIGFDDRFVFDNQHRCGHLLSNRVIGQRVLVDGKVLRVFQLGPTSAKINL